jgi:hypothetical protein
MTEERENPLKFYQRPTFSRVAPFLDCAKLVSGRTIWKPRRRPFLKTLLTLFWRL